MADEDIDDVLGLDELDMNLSDAERPPEPPKGRYRAEVQDVQRAVSQSKGNAYYAIRFVIPASELPASVQEHWPDGYSAYWNRQLVPKPGDRRAAFNMRKLYEALGLDTKTTVVNPATWMGRECIIVLRDGKDLNGEPRAEIASLEALEGAAPSRAAPKAAARPAAGRGRR